MFCLTKYPNVANKDLRPEALNNPQFERQVCLNPNFPLDLKGTFEVSFF